MPRADASASTCCPDAEAQRLAPRARQGRLPGTSRWRLHRTVACRSEVSPSVSRTRFPFIIPAQRDGPSRNGTGRPADFGAGVACHHRAPAEKVDRQCSKWSGGALRVAARELIAPKNPPNISRCFVALQKILPRDAPAVSSEDFVPLPTTVYYNGKALPA